MEREIMLETSRLLEKIGLESAIPPAPASGADERQYLENMLSSLKNLNARYEKSEAIGQVQWLMNNYNIQIDELMERITS